VTEGDRKRDDDEVWRDIVERWEDEPAAEPEPADDDPQPDETWNPKPFAGFDHEERFVPPTPPPMELPPAPRLLAWGGVLGVPVVFVVLMMASVRIPSWASTLLVCAFVGGFVFLVATMRNEPRDPGDDGAVV
jgi:hypothetical protein